MLLPVYTRQILGDPRALGLMLGLSGAGAMVGALVYGVVGARLSRWKTYACCCFVATVPVALVFAARAPLPMLTFAGIYLTVCLPLFVGKVWRGLDTRIDLSVQPEQ